MDLVYIRRINVPYMYDFGIGAFVFKSDMKSILCEF